MNLYFVLSEQMEYRYSYWEPPEPYRIVELVVARNRGQAKYLAIQNDKEHTSSPVSDYPKLSVRLLVKDLPNTEAEIVTTNPDYQHYWELTSRM